MDRIICPICCHDVLFRVSAQIPDFNLFNIYNIIECPICKIQRTFPPPNDIDSFYKNFAFDEPDDKFASFLKGYLIRHEIKRIVKVTSTKKFLDVGCGHGGFANGLFSLGYDVSAADAFNRRPYYLKFQPGIPYTRIRYENVELESPELANNRIVILRHVLEHTRDPKMFLSKFIKLGASYLYIVVPNVHAYEINFFKQYDILWNVPYHLWHFSAGSLKILLENLGVKIIAQGTDTIPTMAFNMAHYCRVKGYPAWIINTLSKNWIVFSAPVQLLFRNNVIWAIARINP